MFQIAWAIAGFSSGAEGIITQMPEFPGFKDQICVTRSALANSAARGRLYFLLPMFNFGPNSQLPYYADNLLR
jgi:hypothetical protein